MALVSPGIQISINDQSQYVNSNVGSVPLVVLATAQDKTYNGGSAVGTSKANAGKLMSFTSQRDLVTAMGTPTFELSSAGTPVNASERNEYGLLAAYSALGLGNRLFAIRADVDLDQLKGTSVRPAGEVADGTYWLDLANTEFGISVLNRATDTFSHISPLLITDKTQVQNVTYDGTQNVPTPLASVGQQGSYALVFVDDQGSTASVVRLFYKATKVNAYAGSGSDLANTWTQVGSTEWAYSNPITQGTITSPTFVFEDTYSCTINSVPVSVSGITTVAEWATAINGAAIPGVRAADIDGQLTLFATAAAKSNNITADGKVVLADGTGTPLANCGITILTPPNGYYCPEFFYGTYSQSPVGGWYTHDTTPRPTGSVWWKTTTIGGGYSPTLKKYNAGLKEWVSVTTPLYVNPADAIYALDPIGGGINIAKDQLVTLISPIDTTANNLQFFVQQKSGALEVTGAVPTSSITGSFNLYSTSPGSNTFSSGTSIEIPAPYDAASFVEAILNAGIPHVSARLNSNGSITLIHSTGGSIVLQNDISYTAIEDAGFVISASPYILDSNGSMLLTNFVAITAAINYSTETPYSAPTDGSLWYYSNLADVDVMINNNGWKGYGNPSPDVRGYDLTATDPNGVIVSATAPTSQSDGMTSLSAGDLWLNSSDVINYPNLSRWTGSAWVSIDNTDHISNNGIIFADARWDLDGTTDPVSDALPSVASLLTSDYVDLDAPDWRLYPRGTLLFNTRRSGYNVKKFVKDYFNPTSFPPASVGNNPGFYPTDTPAKTDAWVTDSGLNEAGVMYAGAAAQRAIVVAALKSAIDSNTDVLDANYQFNLLVAPGYPELIPNLVTLNDNRGATAFVIGDTPMTLAPTATALTAWNSNTDGNGLATSSAYLGVYYPAGLTNDLSGNRVAVPASHAVLRTFLYNDNVSYQWFAPAGVHRGLVSNLSDIGYVNAQTGAFVHNGVNQGLRDTLYTLSINPITQLPGTGLVVWGQETKSGDSSARNRVNVVRLENYLRTIFATISNSFLFEPNDTVTRKSIATQIESALHNVLSKRGVYDFLVICDTSNNTSSTIANNQLYVDVAVEPMRDVEFIYIPIALYNPGTVASLGAANT